MKQLFFLFSLLLPVAGTGEPIYKWKDDNGVVHFSTTPPKKQADTEVMAKPVPRKISNDASQMPENMEHTEAAVKKQTPGGTASETIAETIKAEPPQKTEKELAYCNTLKGHMAQLNNSPRVRVKNKNGEYEILDDSARQREKARIKKLMTDFCIN